VSRQTLVVTGIIIYLSRSLRCMWKANMHHKSIVTGNDVDFGFNAVQTVNSLPSRCYAL
jgi:hypothetical protein